MTHHMPKLKVSENTICGNTIRQMFGQYNNHGATWDGEWIIIDEFNRVIDYFTDQETAESQYPDSTVVGE